MIIGFVGNKGGVGKSTLAIHTACWLHEQGHSVVVVDSDPQGAASRWLQDLIANAPIHKLRTSDDIIETVPQLSQDYEYVVVDGVPAIALR